MPQFLCQLMVISPSTIYSLVCFHLRCKLLFSWRRQLARADKELVCDQSCHDSQNKLGIKYQQHYFPSSFQVTFLPEGVDFLKFCLRPLFTKVKESWQTKCNIWTFQHILLNRTFYSSWVEQGYTSNHFEHSLN